MEHDEIISHNQAAWNQAVEEGNIWTVIANSEQINKARSGNPEIKLSPQSIVSDEWLGHINNKRILALAAGGGQQGPILAAAGAQVSVVDFSDSQLKQDRLAAQKFDLEIETIQTVANDLGFSGHNNYDLIINPCSNCFFPDLVSVWKECFRVLKPGGRLMYCFVNPISYLFDFEKANQGKFELKYTMPYSDNSSLNEEEKKRFIHKNTNYEFAHSLEHQIGSLAKAGFHLLDLKEDYWGNKVQNPIDNFFPQFINVLAQKPK